MFENEEQTLKTNERMSLQVDYAFKRVFGTNGHEEILKDLIEAILEIKIEEIQIQNPEIPRNIKDSKIGTLDVRAKVNDGKIIEIEMQIANQHNIGERSTHYLTKIYADQLKEGDDYTKAKKVIAINILNFNYYKRNSYHSIAKMKFEETKPEKYIEMGYKEEDEIATNGIEMHFIELPKFLKKKPNYNNKLEQWLSFISGGEEAMKKAISKNEQIEQAYKEIERLSEDREEREIYELRMKAIRDEANMKLTGIEIGRKERNIEIAKNMLKKKMNIEDIKEITELTHKETK